ncbi:E3 ubiquitin-protein ligase MIB2-like isoform X2 [Artemia franciscana]|uniref:RING-type E3 ubiquitin transferase n=2 Tax=Artemia franciscana TaxID=6661 RepID=A0AA88HS84_ARTSF|nr:hypothetical protein QYM36_012186 [Artemia franciscana]
MDVGVRVVRGPDWKWGNQDGGEGFVGTVIDKGTHGSENLPDKTVVVQWDMGWRTNYRIGYQNSYDLRIWDNGPTGVSHPEVLCDNCRKHGIPGTLWKCNVCPNYDLCTLCYMADKHDTSHAFVRYLLVDSIGSLMPPRKHSKKTPLKGIFFGSKVVRGPDWDWGNQDGGDGKVGRVLEVRGWVNETNFSVASVNWPSGETNIYRIGHKGKVDLTCVSEAIGAYCYMDHLAILGKTELVCPTIPMSLEAPEGSRRAVEETNTFSVGDRVQVDLDITTLKRLQENHGGWNQRMTELIGRVGVVHRITERGDIRVAYDHCSNRWTINPKALSRVTVFSIGDEVMIIQDKNKIQELQRGHGEWVDAMETTLGKVGKVMQIYMDGDVRVQTYSCEQSRVQSWTFNPLCLVNVSGSTESHNFAGTNQNRESLHPEMDLVRRAPEVQSNEIDLLVHEAAKGKVDKVKEILAKNMEKIDEKSNGKTALQVAAHEGHVEVVKALLQANASMEIQDDEGDTALHYAVFGNKEVLTEMLLMKGAKIDAINKGKCTPLHIAVNKQHVACVKVLIKFNCSLNMQDSFGDTPLHDAICRKNDELVELLVACPGIDLFIKNSRGFNSLHHASLKGNHFAADKIILKSRQLVDMLKDDGFGPLHLATLNNHRPVAELLLVQGLADPNITNTKGHTPLHLAVSQLHPSIVQLLVSHGANLNVQDEEGNTPLHYVLKKHATTTGAISEEESPLIYRIWCDLAEQGRLDAIGLAIACYLIEKGADSSRPNKAKKLPLDFVLENEVKIILGLFMPKKQSPLLGAKECKPSTSSAPDAAAKLMSGLNLEEAVEEPSECVVCCEIRDQVQFIPCGHKIACIDCAIRMKKCLTCKEVIQHKLQKDGISLNAGSSSRAVERLQYLEKRVAEMEEATSCPICLEKRKNVAFSCGHGTCESCAQTLKTCHMCRKPILKRISLY